MPILHPDAADYLSRRLQARQLCVEHARATDPRRRADLAATAEHHDAQALALITNWTLPLQASVQMDVLAHTLRRHPAITCPTAALAAAHLEPQAAA